MKRSSRDDDVDCHALTPSASPKVQYAYTSRNQLSSITADGYPSSATYGYDLAGNRITKTATDPSNTTRKWSNRSDEQLRLR